MAFPYNPLQSKVLAGSGHHMVLGPAGSGKTMLVIDKTAHLLTQGIAPSRIGVAVFAFRSVEHLKSLAKDRYPTLATAFDSVRFGTLRDLAAVQLVQGGKLTSFIGNNQVRTYLRFLMAQQGFSGSLNEAEHIIRSLKSRAKKVPENDRHYPLFKAYKDLLDGRNQADRHDIIRNHIIAMRAEGQGHLPPVPVDYLLVDNVQDATELQTIWLKAHTATATLFLTANDDVTAFTRDGALGTAAITALQDIDGLLTTTLTEHYVTPQGLDAAIGRLPRLLKNRLHKPATAHNPEQGQLTVLKFDSATQEHQWLATQVKRYATSGKRVGVIARTHTQAALFGHVIRKYTAAEGSMTNPASYARLIWDEPTPQTVLALLHVMLGMASTSHLRLTLLGFGVPAATIETWFAQGLVADNWLANGCPLPPTPEASPTTLDNIAAMREMLTSAAKLIQGQDGQRVDPRDAFRAAVQTMLPHLPPADHFMALLATDMLLNLSGKLTEVLPRVVAETLPDPHSPVTVAPVSETRNMQYDVVFLPYFQEQVWPQPAFALLGADVDHERRLAVLALTRSSGTIYLSHHAGLSPYGTELQQALKTPTAR